MKPSFIQFLIIPYFCSLMISSCSINPYAGGGGVEGEGIVVGTIFDEAGQAAPNTLVWLIPSTFDAQKDTFLSLKLYDTTDTNGLFLFPKVDTGSYSLEALQLTARTRALVCSISIAVDTIEIPYTVLHKPGSIRIEMPQNIDSTLGYVCIPGTSISLLLAGTGSTVALDSVPAGTIPQIVYRELNNTVNMTLGANVTLLPGQNLILRPSWLHSRKCILNTTPAGADVAGTVTDFPMLVRLNTGNFMFAEAQAHGEDIRFTKIDGTLLPFEIERWDAAAGQAAIWVKVDIVYGNNGTQAIMMYWGNPQAGSVSNSALVFDTINGFQGVWHLGQAGGSLALDATANKYDGTPYNMSSSSLVPGQIGYCQKFSGDSSYFTMNGTASSKLNFEKDGIYSVSAWVYADTFDLKKHTIVSKGDNQYSLELMDSNEWEFSEYKDLTGWEVTRSSADMKTWTHVAGVRVGAKQYLFINGICTDSSIEMYPDIDPRYTGFDVMIGRTKAITNDYALFFKGKIDELRITNTTPGNDWFRLCYMNQKKQDALVKFNTE